MTFSCSGNYRCRVRNPVGPVGPYGTSTNWDTNANADCVDSGDPYEHDLVTSRLSSASWGATMDATVETVEALDLASLLPTLLPVAAESVHVDVAAAPLAARVVASFSVDTRRLSAFVGGVQTVLGSPALASAALGVDVASVEPVRFAESCAQDGSDDACDDFSNATWASFSSSYYFYFDSPEDDGLDIRYWEWPRLKPTDWFYRNNGVCEDGEESTTGAPTGDYYITFGGAGCATSGVDMSTSGSYTGCGKQLYVPCNRGRDCTDCGRAASVSGGAPERRRRQNEAAAAARATPKLLPPLRDVNATLDFLRKLKSGVRTGHITEFFIPPRLISLYKKL